MGSFSSHILFTFLCVFCSITEIISQESGIEVFEYSYVTRGGKTIQESTTIYLTTARHKVHNGLKWEAGYYYIIGIISSKGKFVLQTFDDGAWEEINGCDNYVLIRNRHFVKKIVICDDYCQIIFYKLARKPSIILSKEKML